MTALTALIAVLAFIAHALWHALLPSLLVALVTWWRSRAPKSRAEEDAEHFRQMAAGDSTTAGARAKGLGSDR